MLHTGVKVRKNVSYKYEQVFQNNKTLCCLNCVMLGLGFFPTLNRKYRVKGVTWDTVQSVTC